MIFPPFCICESIKNYNASYLCCAGFSLSFNKVLMSPIRGHCLVGATISVQICPIYSMSDTFSCRQTTKRETWKSGTHIESNNKIFWAVICATINKISLIFLRIYCSSMISRKKKKLGVFYQLCIFVWYILKHRPFPACLCFCLPRGQRVDLTQRLPLRHLITPRQLDIG